MEYRHFMKYDQHKKVWKHSFSNDLGSLSLGVDKIVKVTDTILFMEYNNNPSECCK